MGFQITVEPSRHVFEAGADEPILEAALRHEEYVSAAIERLYSLAAEARDFASYPLLQWFVSEQIEEESSVGLIVEQLRMAGNDPSSLLMLDRELGGRREEPAAQ